MSPITKRTTASRDINFGPSAFPVRGLIAQVLALMLFAQSAAPPALAARARGFSPAPLGSPSSAADLQAVGSDAPGAPPPAAAVSREAGDFGLVLTPLGTSFNGHAGIEHHEPLKKVIVSSNGPAGAPLNFETLDADGTHRPFSNVSGLTGELKIATARDDGQGMSRGGFRPGELFTGTGAPGVVARLAPDGALVRNPWVTLPGEVGLLGGLFVDRTGVFGGDLITVTTSGGVWRISSAGGAARVADLGTPLEGVTTVPDDTSKYGPWAGKILAGAKEKRAVYAIDRQGKATTHQLGIAPEDLRIIPAHENFYGTDPVGRKIWGAPDDAFTGLVGDILIAQGEPGALARVRWNGAEFEVGQIAGVESWEQITFSPAAVSEIGGVKQVYDRVAVVRHAPQLDSGRVEGALWQLLPENVVLDGRDVITSDLLVPGTPTVTVGAGRPNFGGVVEGLESSLPSGYSVTVSNNASLRQVVTRTDPINLNPVKPPPAPAGTRGVSLSRAGEGFGDPSTLRDLSISGKAGEVAVPPGTYGKFSASGQTSFVLGVRDSDAPAVYNLEELSLSGGSELRLAGPVQLNVKGNVSLVGSTVGAADHPRRLLLQIAQGSLNVSGNGVLYGVARIPRGTVSIVGNGRIRGTVMCDRLNVGGNGVLQITESDIAPPPINRPPKADAGPDQAVTLPANSVSLSGTASDDGLPAGRTLTSGWTKVSGPGAVTFADSASAVTTATFTEPGLYVLRLTASDSLLTGSDETRVEIELGNQPPQVNAGPDRSVVLPGAAVLAGTATDDGLPQGGGLTTRWTKVSGPGLVTFADAGSPGTTARFSVAGRYVLRLTASDTLSAVNDECVVKVLPRNAPPAVSAGPDQELTFLEAATLKGTASDDGMPVGSLAEVAWSKVSGPGAVVFDSPDSPATAATFSAPGTYVLRLTGDDTELKASDETTVVVRPRPHASRVYTLDADFDQGGLINVAHSTPDQLRLDETARSFNFIWVAVSSKGTIVKINTETGAVLGEYFTSPQGQPRDPSRTTVDLNGNVWATNRDGNSVVHVGLVENGQCADRNNNGVIDTSNGQNDLRPWTNAGGADTGGGVSTAEDECILHYTRVSSYGTRHVSVTKDNDVWVSGTIGRQFDLLDGRTGLIKRSEPSTNYGGYGGLIDKAGVIWSARNLLRWDTSKPLTGPNGINWRGYNHDSYGLCIDSKGNVWNTALFGDQIYKFGPDGTYLAAYQHGHLWAQGCVVDKNDDVWVAHSLNADSVGHLKNDGTFVGNVVVGGGPTGVAVDGAGKIWATNHNSGTVARIDPALGPVGGDGVTRVGAVDFTTPYLGGRLYNYSDMTGSTLTGAPNTGTWSVVFDSRREGAEWGRVGWTAQVCGDGLLSVSLATSEDNASYSQPVTVSNGDDPAVPNGRYAKIAVRFERASGGESPVLYDLSVGTLGFPLDTPANVAPGVDAGTDRTINGTTKATLRGSACDDALPSSRRLATTWSQVSGPGTATFADPDSPVTDVDFSEEGTYVLRLAATDSAHTGSDTLAITVIPGNRPPAVNAGPDLSVTLPSKASLNGAITDDGLPPGAAVTSTWGMASGPGLVTFADPSSPSTTAAFSEPGTYVLRLTATDTESTANDTLLVNVSPVPPNLPPTVNAGADQVIDPPANSAALRGSANDDGNPSGGSLTYAWTKVSGPGAVTFSDPSAADTTAAFSDAGVYVLRLTASDTQLTGSADVRVTLNGPNKAPTANAGADQAAAHPTTVTLTGIATDDGLPAGSSLTLNWAQVSGPGTVVFTDAGAAQTAAAFSAPGTYVLRLSVSDTELTTTDDVTVTLAPPPTADISSPADGMTVTGPVDFVGTVGEGSTWRLEHSLNEEGAEPVWTTLASGSAPVTDGPLGRFDPTILLNGLYTVRLVATNAAGQTTTKSVTVTADSEQKVGHFRLSFLDLSVPLAGIPIEVVRTYDSRDKRVGDFGVGWSLDVRNVRLQESGSVGAGWEGVFVRGLLPGYCVQQAKPRYVTVALSDDHVYRFEATATPQCSTLYPLRETTIGFRPLPGTDATLAPVGGATVFVDASFPGTAELLDYDTAEPADFDRYRLTLPSGAVLLIDQRGGLREATDANGNKLTVNGDGIIHSSGRSVLFTRDAQNRITRITDPAGRSLGYAYDPNGDLISMTDQEGRVTRYAYNSSHGLLDILDPANRRGVRNEYDDAGRLVSMTDAEGKAVRFEFDPDSRQQVVTDRRGNATVYEYDRRGNTVSVTDAEGNVTRSTYDRAGNRLTETDALGNTTSYTYDARGNVLSKTDAENRVTRFTYNERNQQTGVTDPNGNRTTNTYDAAGNLLTTTDALGNATTFTYDARGNVLTKTDAAGRVASFEYDANSNMTMKTDRLGHVTRYAYDPLGNRTSVTDPKGYTTRFTYDGTGLLTSTTDALGNTTRNEYDATGQLSASVDALGRRTETTGNTRGQPLQLTHADGTQIAFRYDADGHLAGTSAAGGHAPAIERNAVNLPTKLTVTPGVTLLYRHDAKGRKTAETDPRGHATSYQYNLLDKVTLRTDGLGRQTRYGYDAAGNLTEVTDPAGNTYTFTYDAANRRVRTTQPDGTFFENAYDRLGQVVSQRDAAGHVTAFTYDAEGRLLAVTQPGGGVARYEYDANGNLTSLTDAAGRTTRLEYDELSRLVRKTFPDGTTELIAYRGSGPPASTTDRKGNVTTYEYDSLDRVTLARYADGKAVAYTYTPTGQRDTVKDYRGVTDFDYDARGNLQRVRHPDGTIISYSYDAAGNRTAITTPDGMTLYAYDSVNRLARVTDPRGLATSYAHDASGNVVRVAHPNGLTTFKTYDPSGRVSSVKTTTAAGSVRFQETYARDANGNRVKVTRADGSSAEYAYDAQGRLTKEAYKDAGGALLRQLAYTYDAVGNRLTMADSAAGTTVTYTYNANDQLTSDGANTFEYDANGNTISKTNSGGTTRYAYDARNRLAQVIQPDNSTLSYSYDADGNRVRAADAGGAAVSYVLDPTGAAPRVVAETDGGGRVVASYTYGLELLSQRRGGADSFYLQDALGSVRALADAGGAITDSYSYDAFGQTLAAAGATTNPFLYAGEQRDAATGLYYLRARYYDPAAGRFISMDRRQGALRDPQDQHKYVYAKNNPVNLTDPTGLSYTMNEGGDYHRLIGEYYISRWGDYFVDKLNYPPNKGFPPFPAAPRPGYGAYNREILTGRHPIWAEFLDLIDDFLPRGRPDLRHYFWGDVYEVKPLTRDGVAKAWPEAEMYVITLNILEYGGPELGLWSLGSETFPGLVSLGSPASPVEAISWPILPLPGVVFYTTDLQRDLRSPELAAVIIGVGVLGAMALLARAPVLISAGRMAMVTGLGTAVGLSFAL